MSLDKIPIGIKSCLKNLERRTAIKDTWLYTLDQNKFFPVFLIGRKNQESELIHNILYLNCDDHYEGLSGKVREFYKWAIKNTIASHYWTCDDDSYMNCKLFNRYNKYLAYDYSGSFIYGIDKIQDKLSGYTSGCGTCLSKKAAEICINYLPDSAFNDDVTIGNILNSYLLDIKKLHINEIYPWSNCTYYKNLLIGHYVHKGDGSLDTFYKSMKKMHLLYSKN